MPLTFPTILGIDFSGARLAGTNTWLARLGLPSVPQPLLHRLETGPTGRDPLSHLATALHTRAAQSPT